MSRRTQQLKTLRYSPREVKEFFSDIRSQPTYPVVHGDPLLLLYDLLTVMQVPESEIYEYLGPRGYLRIAKVRRVNGTRLANILLGDAEEVEEDEQADECIRLVDNQGKVKLWQGQTLQLQPVLAGQYVRVEFMLDGIDRPGIGRAVWRGREEIVVAEFTHRLGVGYNQRETLVGEVRFRDFGSGDLPRNQRYDEVEYAQGEARRLFGLRPTRSE